jgi:hypothetical protein
MGVRLGQRLGRPAVAALVLIACAAPARASGGTSRIGITLQAGTLSISASTGAFLGTRAAGSAGSLSGQLGAVTVDDTRGGAGSGWTATVRLSAPFTAGGFTIPANRVSYWSGPATAQSGTGTRTPGQPSSTSQVSLGSTRTAFTLSASSTGVNSTSWNPTLVVNLQASDPSATYTGTITHSVA